MPKSIIKPSDLSHDNIDLILDAIYANESSSGKNPKAYVPDKNGSIGGYQITPGTFQTVANNFPDKYKGTNFRMVANDDNFGRTVASDLVSLNKNNLISKGFTPTTELLLGSYNGGPGIYKTNTRVGTKVRSYIDKGMSYINSRKAKT